MLLLPSVQFAVSVCEQTSSSISANLTCTNPAFKMLLFRQYMSGRERGREREGREREGGKEEGREGGREGEREGGRERDSRPIITKTK